MQAVGFNYNGVSYTGSLISSDAEAPEYYWCFFDNTDLISELGECITFIRKREDLQTTRSYNDKYSGLIDNIRSAILPLLKKPEWKTSM